MGNIQPILQIWPAVVREYRQEMPILREDRNGRKNISNTLFRKGLAHLKRLANPGISKEKLMAANYPPHPVEDLPRLALVAAKACLYLILAAR